MAAISRLFHYKHGMILSKFCVVYVSEVAAVLSPSLLSAAFVSVRAARIGHICGVALRSKLKKSYTFLSYITIIL